MKVLSKEYILANKEKSIKVAVIALIVIAALFVFFMRTGEDDMPLDTDSSKSEKKAEEGASETSEDVIICDVSGEVKEPQVVELKKGARVEDAIQAAGGLSENADISNVNRAAKVSDGEKIFIPASGAKVTSGNVASGSSDGKISINSADSTKLQEITGVGPAIAQKIISYREKNGAFQKIEDLKKVSGIGDKTFEKMRDEITL